MKMTQTLPNDIFQHTLYQLDIEDIANLCTTNKSLAKICQQRAFWDYIFKRDGLKIKNHPTTIDDYIDHYYQQLQIKEEILFAMRLIDKYNIKNIILYFNNNGYSVERDDTDAYHIGSNTIAREEFMLTLRDLLYQYPNLVIHGKYKGLIIRLLR